MQVPQLMDIYDLARLMEGVGFKVSRNKRTSHWRFTSPSGEHFGFSSTPSDWRAIKNFHSELRRAGYDTRLLKAQYERALIEESHVRYTQAVAATPQFEKMVVVRATPVRPRRTEAELRAHREEMRSFRQ